MTHINADLYMFCFRFFFSIGPYGTMSSTITAMPSNNSQSYPVLLRKDISYNVHRH